MRDRRTLVVYFVMRSFCGDITSTKDASCMHGYLSDAENAIPNPIGQAQLKLATQKPKQVLVCFFVAKHVQTFRHSDTRGVSHDASLMFDGIMITLNQVLW